MTPPTKTSLVLEGIAWEMFLLRFRAKVDRRGPDDCWPWLGTTNHNGYGVVTVRKPVTILAHRAAWEIEHGGIPPGLLVCHSCDNPPCANPGHLFLGTNADNMRDMFAKGRRQAVALVGSAHPAAKLSEDDVRAIRAERGTSYRELMERYDVGRSTIYRIWDDEDPHWAHVKTA